MNNKKEYYVVMSEGLAKSLAFIYSLKYYVYDHEDGDGKKIYSFEKTPELKNAIDELMKIRRNYK